MNGRWDKLQVDADEMLAYTTVPPGDGPFPGVLVCIHAPGVDGFIQGIASRLADAGFASIAPDLYHRQTEPEEDPLKRMAKLCDSEVLRDLDTASALLRSLPRVSSDRTGVIGFCMGGRLAYLTAARDAALRASVVFYGGNIQVPWGEGAAPFDLTERIACPVLGLFGEDDTNPSPDDVAKLDSELNRFGKTHEFKSYPGAGHAFMNADRPSYVAKAAEDAWQRCTAWLTQYLS